MPNRQVPRSEWFKFLRGFSSRHEEEPVTMRVLSPAFGSQVEARDMPLGWVLAVRGVRGPITISAGRAPQGSVEHEIADPAQVWIKLSDGGAEEALVIESLDGSRTILQLGPSSSQSPRALLPS
jgi:uncharacterized protein DUF5335